MAGPNRKHNGSLQTGNVDPNSRSITRRILRILRDLRQNVTEMMTIERKPEYRRIIEEALRTAGSTQADRTLSAYRAEPLCLIHSSHYPIIHTALRNYAEEASNREIEPVLAQVENVMTNSSR